MIIHYSVLHYSLNRAALSGVYLQQNQRVFDVNGSVSVYVGGSIERSFKRCFARIYPDREQSVFQIDFPVAVRVAFYDDGK